MGKSLKKECLNIKFFMLWNVSMYMYMTIGFFFFYDGEKEGIKFHWNNIQFWYLEVEFLNVVFKQNRPILKH